MLRLLRGFCARCGSLSIALPEGAHSSRRQPRRRRYAVACIFHPGTSMCGGQAAQDGVREWRPYATCAGLGFAFRCQGPKDISPWRRTLAHELWPPFRALPDGLLGASRRGPGAPLPMRGGNSIAPPGSCPPDGPARPARIALTEFPQRLEGSCRLSRRITAASRLAASPPTCSGVSVDARSTGTFSPRSFTAAGTAPHLPFMFTRIGEQGSNERGLDRVTLSRAARNVPACFGVMAG